MSTAPAKLNLCIPGIACRTVFFKVEETTEAVRARILRSWATEGYEPGDEEVAALDRLIDDAREERLNP